MRLLSSFLMMAVMAVATMCVLMWLYSLVYLICLKIRLKERMSADARNKKYGMLFSDAYISTLDALYKRTIQVLLTALVVLVLLWLAGTEAEQQRALECLVLLCVTCAGLFATGIVSGFTVAALTPADAGVDVSRMRGMSGRLSLRAFLTGLAAGVINWIVTL